MGILEGVKGKGKPRERLTMEPSSSDQASLKQQFNQVTSRGHFDLKTSRFPDFCHFLRVSFSENLVSEKKFRKKVSVSVSETLDSKKKSQFQFQKIWLPKNLGTNFGEFGLGKKVSVSENLVSKKSIGFRKFGIPYTFSIHQKKKSRYQLQSKFWYSHSVVTSSLSHPGTLHMTPKYNFFGRNMP